MRRDTHGKATAHLIVNRGKAESISLTPICEDRMQYACLLSKQRWTPNETAKYVLTIRC